jgi:TetR/AcrR family transcriptional regulator, transcriptional repressor for nem operon
MRMQAPGVAASKRPVALRQLNKERTRQALVDAALASFSEQGLDAPSLDAICARAGCTRGAFYVHFADRDALIAATMERRRGDVLDALLGGPDVTIDSLLDTLARAIEGGHFPIPGAVRSGELVAACRRSSTIRATQVRLLRRALGRVAERVGVDQSRGRLRKDVDASALALVLVLVEAGAELLLDLGFPVDAPSATGALRRLVAPAGAARKLRR